MPLYLDDFIQIIAEICEEKKLKAAVSESFKGGVLTGISAIIGGLLFGPVGLAVGGALGGGVSAISSNGKFQPVATIILNLTPRQKERLYDKVHYAFRDFGIADVMTLSTLLVSQTACRETALKVVKNYLHDEMSLQIF